MRSGLAVRPRVHTITAIVARPIARPNHRNPFIRRVCSAGAIKGVVVGRAAARKVDRTAAVRWPGRCACLGSPASAYSQAVRQPGKRLAMWLLALRRHARESDRKRRFLSGEPGTSPRTSAFGSRAAGPASPGPATAGRLEAQTGFRHLLRPGAHGARGARSARKAGTRTGQWWAEFLKAGYHHAQHMTVRGRRIGTGPGTILVVSPGRGVHPVSSRTAATARSISSKVL